MFVLRKHDEDLARFAADICRLLSVAEPEERESSNWAEGRYFRSRALGIDVRIGIADYDDFDFLVWVDASGAPINDRSFIAGLEDLIARVMALSGYRVARPVSPYIGSPIVWYRKNEQVDAPYEEAVIIEERSS